MQKLKMTEKSRGKRCTTCLDISRAISSAIPVPACMCESKAIRKWAKCHGNSIERMINTAFKI
jgi:hypothetical protein